jgi:WD40 repeat protein
VKPGGGPAGQPSGPPGEPELPSAAWEVGPAEDVLPGLVGRPAKIDGLRRWQVETAALSSEPRCVAWSTDGKLLAVGMASGEIRLLEGSTLRPVRFLYGHEGLITALSWTKAGRLASAGMDKTIRLWEPDGTPGPVLRDADAVLAVAWKPDGTLLASGGQSRLARLWESDGTPARVLSGHTEPVKVLTWSPDGRRLASVADSDIRFWQGDGSAGPVLKVEGEHYFTAAWNPDGTRLASATSKGFRLWDNDGKAGSLSPGSAFVMSWSANGRMFATGMIDGQLRLWDAEFKPGVVLDLRGPSPENAVFSVSWSPDSQHLAACSTAGIVGLWDPDGKPGPVLRRGPALAAVAWSPDGQHLASGGEDRHVRLWGADGRPGPVFTGHKSPVESVCWSPDGQQLASACTFHSPDPIRLWGADGKEGPVIQGGSAPAVWSPDGQLLVSRRTGAHDGWGAVIWDARTNRQVTALKGLGACSWSPDSQQIAAVGAPNGVGTPNHVVLLRRDGTVQRSFDRRIWGGGIGWSPDGRHIANGVGGGVELRASTGELGQFLESGGVQGVSWAPDSQQLAAAVSDGTFRVWGTDGKAGPVVRAHGDAMRSVSWAGKGNRLASSGSDSTIRVYDAASWQALWTAVVLRDRPPTVFSPAGQILEGNPATADEDFVYIAQTDAGRFELFAAREFQKKALRDGKPLALFGPRTAPPGRPVDDAWVQQVQQKPLTQQCEEVLARLKELNPGFFDPFEHKEANGQVAAVVLPPSPALRDLSPLRALTGLEQLTINGPEKGTPLPLADLKPLAGLKLKELTCTGVSVADLAPLAGMPLEKLTLRNAPVADLKLLKGLPLTALTLRDTRVADLAPLKGVPGLQELDVRGSPVTDLKPLQALLLKSLACDVEPKRDAEILRGMPSLTRINDQDAPAFFAFPAMQLALEKWVQDLAALPLDKWTEAVAVLPADKQLIALDVKLVEGTPHGFSHPVWRSEVKDGRVFGVWIGEGTVFDMDLTPVLALRDLHFINCGQGASFGALTKLPLLKGTKIKVLDCKGNLRLPDLSPLQGATLTKLDCSGTGVADLSPLKGMPLTSLGCAYTRVTDLSPLRGMKLSSLTLSRSPVKDLSPLQGMPLTNLDCSVTQVTDLSPLRGLPLKALTCDFKPERDAEILRSLKTLETINGKPAAEFWKEVDAKK